MDKGFRNIFDYLDPIRVRPEMWLPHISLYDLESLICGYYAALDIRGIVEDVPRMDHHFTDWMKYHTNESRCLGFPGIIEERHKDPEEAIAAFFAFMDEFRKLRPAIIATVKLAARHKPTGKRISIGLDGRIDKPDRVDIVRYRPEPLHFLRFHYGDRVEDERLLTTGTGEYATTIRHAKRWVRDELQVEYQAWRQFK